MSRGSRSLLLAIAVSATLVGTRAAAQLSPGPLARGHEALEGTGHCLDCHEQGQGVSPAKCLACHERLRERVAAGRGLHARPEYGDCKSCHVEHQGRKFELVYWGRRGRTAFDHALTGHALRGRHRRLACEDCHTARFGRPAEREAPAHTFLGLDPACGSCHEDPHRGTRLGSRSCDSCHGEDAWSPAPAFDHALTGFVLAGRHAAAGCAACHARAAARSGRGDRRLGEAKGTECAACHADPHARRLGTACAACHNTVAWKDASVKAASAGFDHDRTGYPLRGRHTGIACAVCHLPGRGLRKAHDQCTDCHADVHLGQLAQRPDKGRCDACHDVNGFAPARFSVEDHARTAYPLEGSHLAVPCNGCHPKVSAREIAPSARPPSGRTTVRFRSARTRCHDCHQDPHRGEVDAQLAKGGCESCHRVSAWKDTAFDHGTTRFALTGGHSRVGCPACHPRVEVGTARERVRLLGTPLACAGCHRDPHAGQFASSAGEVACERCHTTVDLKASRFDHDRDSAFVLDGAHERLMCAACHREETDAGARVVRYKPLGTTCRDCHQVAAPGAGR